MKGYRRFAIAFVLAGLSAPLPALAQNLTADPARIAAILAARKMPVTHKKDNQGDPMIETQFEEEAKFSIYFYGCTAGKNCNAVQMVASYTKTKAGAAEMLKWNREMRFARAYLDGQNEPELAMDIDLSAGGISLALFKEQLDSWESLMTDFSATLYSED